MKFFLLIINFLLITAAVFYGVDIFSKIANARFNYVNYVQLPRKPRKNIPPPKEKTCRSLSFYNAIIERNLFKTKKVAENKLSPVKIENLEPTDLDIKLWGTVTGRRDNSYAVVEEIAEKRRNRKQNLYRAGDSVQNATIKKILREKVILSINGKNEVLEIEERHSFDRRRKHILPTIRQKRTLSRAMIEYTIKNVNALLKQANIRPHSEGIYITRIKPNSVYRKMGLRNGDIITSVDGRYLKSVDDALSLYKNLKSSSHVTLGLKRRGRLRIINYNIK